MLIEIFILLLLTFQVVNRSNNWSNSDSSSRTSKCCSSSSVSSSVDRMPFGQWIFPFKYFLRFNLIHKSILKTRYFDNLNAQCLLLLRIAHPYSVKFFLHRLHSIKSTIIKAIPVLVQVVAMLGLY